MSAPRTLHVLACAVLLLVVPDLHAEHRPLLPSRTLPVGLTVPTIAPMCVAPVLAAHVQPVSPLQRGNPQRPPRGCVTTFECGGCCGTQAQIDAFENCCSRGGGFACAQRHGCS